jgi:hypothetical protein
MSVFFDDVVDDGQDNFLKLSLGSRCLKLYICIAREATFKNIELV